MPVISEETHPACFCSHFGPNKDELGVDLRAEKHLVVRKEGLR